MYLSCSLLVGRHATICDMASLFSRIHGSRQLWRLSAAAWNARGLHRLNMATSSGQEEPLYIFEGIAPISKTEYPNSPKVGIGVVLLRRRKKEHEVLLVRRGKEPEKGKLTFPGGSLELGETMAECAAREVMEETGLRLLNQAPVDIIRHDHRGRLRFHYTIIDIAALPEDPQAKPKAADDAEEVLWIPVNEMRGFEDISADHVRIAEAACERFDIPNQ